MPNLSISSLVFGAALVVPAIAQAAIVTSTDRNAFLAAATGVPFNAVPNTGLQAGGAGTFGGLTLSMAAGASQLFFGAVPGVIADWSLRIPGADVALSGPENFDASVGFQMFAFGFDVDEPTSIAENFGIYFVDSIFEVTLRLGGTTVDSFTFNPDNDVRAFIGVHSSLPFDNVQVREINNEPASGGEDEFFGNFVYGRVALPTPGAGSVLAAGALVVLRRRRR